MSEQLHFGLGCVCVRDDEPPLSPLEGGRLYRVGEEGLRLVLSLLLSDLACICDTMMRVK